MDPHQFYVRVGELVGQFKAVMPALNYLRGRVDTLVREVDSVSQAARLHQETLTRDIERLRDEMKVFKEEVRGRLSSGTTDFHTIDRKLDEYDRRLKALEDRGTDTRAKRWQMMVMIVSASLSFFSALAVALILYFVKK